MEKKFRVKKSLIEKDIRLIENGLKSIQHDLAYLEARTEPPTENEKAVLKAKELQQARRIEKLSVKWLEFLLEYIDYYRMNRLHTKPQGIANISREFSQFKDTLHRYMSNEAYTPILARAGRGIQVFCDGLNK